MFDIFNPGHDMFNSSQATIDNAVKEVNKRLLTDETYTHEQARDDLLQTLGLPPIRPKCKEMDWGDI